MTSYTAWVVYTSTKHDKFFTRDMLRLFVWLSRNEGSIRQEPSGQNCYYHPHPPPFPEIHRTSSKSPSVCPLLCIHCASGGGFRLPHRGATKHIILHAISNATNRLRRFPKDQDLPHPGARGPPPDRAPARPRRAANANVATTPRRIHPSVNMI